MHDNKIKIIKKSELTKTPVNHKGRLFKKVILSNSDVPGLIQLATAQFNSNDKVEIHSHESMTEVFYLLSGSLKLYMDEEEYEITGGDSFVVFPKHSHGFVFTKRSKLIYFNLPSTD